MQTVVLADEHPVVLCGLQRFLGETGEFEIVASCFDGFTALSIIRENKPDLAVLDVSLPGLSGFDVLTAAMCDAPSTRVVLLSEPRSEVAAVPNGAWGMISKAATASEMLHSLRRVAAGYRAFSYDGGGVAFERAVANGRGSEPEATLTAREREIAVLVAAGMSNKEIAARILISVGTVKIHLSNIFQKLSLTNRTSLAAMTLQQAEFVRRADRASIRARRGSAPDPRSHARFG
jgi:DNA-binding NarL/FixJ family response regulator